MPKFPSLLDRAIPASVAAMVAMVLFVLSQQLTIAPQFASAPPAPTAQQA